MNYLSKKKKSYGFSLIEIVVGVSIIAITFVGLVSTYNIFFKVALKNTKKIQSAYLLEEGLEAIRSVRDESWDGNIASLATNTNLSLTYNGSEWVVGSGGVMIDGLFFRQFKVFDVYRDANNDISSSGILDSETKFFTVSVAWVDRGATTTESMSAY